MAATRKTLRVCSEGHQYYKSSSCPVCPICEKAKIAAADFLKIISAPARRALEGAGIKSLESLSKYTEVEILKLHGMGPGSVPKLREALREQGLAFAI